MPDERPQNQDDMAVRYVTHAEFSAFAERVDRGFSEVTRELKGITRTNWPVLLTGVGLMLSFLVAGGAVFTSGFVGPMRDDIRSADARVRVLERDFAVRASDHDHIQGTSDALRETERDVAQLRVDLARIEGRQPNVTTKER